MPRPLIAGLAVALLGLAFVAYGFTHAAPPCDRPGWTVDGRALWPPGATECHRHPTPLTTERRTALPWGDWATVALVAASAGLFLAALTAPRRRAAKGVGAYALFWASLFSWFFGRWELWGPLLAAAAVAIVLTARRPRAVA